MAARQRWSDLSSTTRRLIVAFGVVEGILKLAALRDLRRRPASRIRGRKWMWATSLGLVGSGGLLPICYFVFGRRPAEAGS